MYKMWVIARREYLAAVRTKTFIISLVIMPLLMGGSILLERVLRNVVDVQEKKFVVVDRVGAPDLVTVLNLWVEKRNEFGVRNESGKQIKPRFNLQDETPGADAETQNYDLSERIRHGQLIGFLEILGPDALKTEAKSQDFVRISRPKFVLRYHTNRPTYEEFSRGAGLVLDEYVRTKIGAKAGMDQTQVHMLLKPTVVETRGLSKKDESGKIVEGSEEEQMASVIAPLILMMLMFVVILMGATPLMQGVVEEKMQRIAEVLLGCVRPFTLMMGKLIGMAAVSLTISFVYLGGAYWAANYYGFAEHISLGLLAWFLILQALAALMFGSLFIAIGAACTEMRETQNLLWPVMLLASFPMFLLAHVLNEPNSPVVRGVSFFPFATPSLMVARMAAPPGIPWWEPALASLGVLATTVFCVYAAGRIFRVGLLLQGKGARVSEILRWVVKG